MMVITKRTRIYEITTIKRLKGVKVLEERNGQLLLEVQTDRSIALVDFYLSDLKWKRRESRACGESVRSLKAYFKLDEE